MKDDPSDLYTYVRNDRIGSELYILGYTKNKKEIFFFLLVRI